MKKIKENIPNLITISRIISCALGATFFTLGNLPLATFCYAYGAISDACDGYLARKLNAITELGKKLDPISDKLFALSLIAPAILLGNYAMIITLVLEAAISAVNIYSDIKYQKTHTEKIGKRKTIFLFPTMIMGLLSVKIPLLYVGFFPFWVISSKYQAKTLQVYVEQLENHKKNNININKNNANNILKTNDINKEIESENKTNNINYCNNNSNTKQKKRIRKKD